MLDDDDSVAGVAQLVQHFEQQINVGKVQAGGGLVQDVDRAAGVALAEFERKLGVAVAAPASKWRSTTRELLRRVDPVLYFQRRYPCELPHVVRHQHQAFATGVRCNVHVVHADRLAEFF